MFCFSVCEALLLAISRKCFILDLQRVLIFLYVYVLMCSRFVPLNNIYFFFSFHSFLKWFFFSLLEILYSNLLMLLWLLFAVFCMHTKHSSFYFSSLFSGWWFECSFKSHMRSALTEQQNWTFFFVSSFISHSTIFLVVKFRQSDMHLYGNSN